ncbi:MAG: GNAT family N-acetyltransferase [Gemmatimonadales bacterium]
MASKRHSASGVARPPSGRSFELRRYDSIAEVDPEEWNAFLDPDDLQATHRFISVCERSRVADASYRHILVYHADTLVGIASFSRMEVALDLLAGRAARLATRFVRRFLPSFARVRVAFCGLPVSFGRSLLRFRRGAPAAAIAELVAGELERWADECDARVLCFKEFDPAEVDSLDSLAQQGYFRAPSLPFCTLPLRWPSFEAYLRAMRAGYRRQVLASLRARRRLNLSVRAVDDFGPQCPRIFQLYEQVMDRAEFQLEHLNLAFFERLNADLGSQSRAILIEQRGELIAAAVMLYGPTEATFLLAGIDYAQNRQCHAYLNLVTEVVADAIRSGAARLELGQTSYDLKRRHGADTFPRFLYLKCNNRVGQALLRAARGVMFPTHAFTQRRVFKEP